MGEAEEGAALDLSGSRRLKRIGCVVALALIGSCGAVAIYVHHIYPSPCYFAARELCAEHLDEDECERLGWGIEALELPEARCAAVRGAARGSKAFPDGAWSDAADMAQLELFRELLLGSRRLTEARRLIADYEANEDRGARDAVVERARTWDPSSCIAFLDTATPPRLRERLFDQWGAYETTATADQWCFEQWAPQRVR